MKKIQTQEDYINEFNKVPENLEKVLQQIQDTRKFEIEMYWKRTTFFWTILAAIITGFFLIYIEREKLRQESLEMAFLLACLGLVFSIAWYLVNRGSKYWQVNWEKHLFCIEDEIGIPLYKITISRTYLRKRFHQLLSPFPFSVTKILHVLNIGVISLWAGILINFNTKHITINLNKIENYFSFYTLTFAITTILIFSLFLFTHTGKKWAFQKEKGEKKVDFEKIEIGEDKS